MADDRGADRSSVEIKTLIRKLHPSRGNHKDRIRQLNKFRNYVIGDRVGFRLCKRNAPLRNGRVCPH